MKLNCMLFGHKYEFKSLKEVMAKANEEKSGDRLAGLAAESAEERVAAKVTLSEVTLKDLRENPADVYKRQALDQLKKNGYTYEILFLDASNDSLMK